MDLFELFIKHYILRNKAEYSRQIAKKTPKIPLPIVGSATPGGEASPELLEEINKRAALLPYKLDPLQGLNDYYTHPETVQYEVEMATRRQPGVKSPYDCDDLALYAYSLAEKAGVAFGARKIWNLIIAPQNQVTQMWANHVIAAFKFTNHQGEWWCVIDTNTAYGKTLFWFQGNEAQAKVHFIRHFSGVYNVNYYKIIAVEPPF